MRTFIIIAFLFMVSACQQHDSQVKEMQAKIDSLEKELDNTFKPGFGEFMSGIQTHHAKLWFAGLNQNWPLADFEVHEILESLEDIKTYCNDRPETKAIGMINFAIDSINNSIQQKNLPSFKSSFILLTNTCNNCHRETDHSFNVVTVPNNLPVVNQDFKPTH